MLTPFRLDVHIIKGRDHALVKTKLVNHEERSLWVTEKVARYWECDYELLFPFLDDINTVRKMLGDSCPIIVHVGNEVKPFDDFCEENSYV